MPRNVTLIARRAAAAVRVTTGLAVAGLAAGCGGAETAADPATIQAGAQVFNTAGCGTCHTLAAAKARGQVGPNLDQHKPDIETVTRKVQTGGGGMPSFADRLSEEEINAVAAYVARTTGGRP